MRADRLLAILLLLQSRREMTAVQLAEQLEVSVRTIYRDIQALSAAGVPVYTIQGPGGGCRLVDEYRTNLTGLTPSEIDALRLLNLPESLATLDAGRQLKTALIKLFAALPGDQSQASSRRVYLDWSGWGIRAQQKPLLKDLYKATMNDQRLLIHYHLANHLPIEQVIEPYGLVAKAGDWRLVYKASEKIRIKRVDEFDSVQILAETFNRQEDFNLVEIWNDYAKAYERGSKLYRVIVRVDPQVGQQVKWILGRGAHEVNKIETDNVRPDKLILEIAYQSFAEARTQLLGLGGAVEVLEPLTLRWSIVDFASQIIQVYNKTSKILD